jgi:regulator of nucleoside diphosphate kinase
MSHPCAIDGALAPITLTTTDVHRLDALLATRVGVAYRAESRRLRGELRRASVIPSREAPLELVTMNSRLVYADVDTHETHEITLVYPWRATERCAVSVFSPIGTALLGLRVGDSIAWTLDDGSVKVLRVSALLYQPEAAGHWHL